MSDIKFVKDYREKELRQYVLAYLLITVAFVGFNTVAELQEVLGRDRKSTRLNSSH